MDPHPELRGREFAGYRMGEYLGQGGSGPMYAGTMLDGGARVAIKVFDIFGLLPEPVRREFQAQLEAEAREASHILHPSVAQVLAVGSLDDMPCVVSEFVEGERLDAVLERNRTVDEAAAAAMVRQVAAGVRAIHDAGLIHGDVKPGNVIVRTDGIPVLVDLGHAKSDPRLAALTRMGREPGTPLYQPPEQVEGEPATVAGGVFGLGGTLLALVTGAGATPEERKRALQSDVAPELRRVILTAMAKAPGDRFGSAAALIEGIDELRARAAGQVDRSSATVLLEGSTPKRRSTGARPKPPAPEVPVAESDDDIETLPAENIVAGPDEATISDAAAAPPAEVPRRKTGTIRRPTGAVKRPTGEVSKPKTERVQAADVAAEAAKKPRTERVKADDVAAAARKTERAGRPGTTVRDKSRRTERPGRTPARGGGGRKLVGALFVLALLGGGGYAAWHFLGTGGSAKPKPEPEVAEAPVEAEGTPEAEAAPEAEAEPAAGEPAKPPTPAQPAPAPDAAAQREAAAAKALAGETAEAERLAALVAEVERLIAEGGLARARERALELPEGHARRAELLAAIEAAETRSGVLAGVRAHVEARRWAEARVALDPLPADAPGVAELRAAIEAGEAEDAARAAAAVEASAAEASKAEAGGGKAETALADAARGFGAGRGLGRA